MSDSNKVLPYLTAAIPGIGGVIRAQMEDFRVEERPLYLPCGQGEHTYLRVTKRGLSHSRSGQAVCLRLGRQGALRSASRDSKDARAVTTQMVSVQLRQRRRDRSPRHERPGAFDRSARSSSQPSAHRTPRRQPVYVDDSGRPRRRGRHRASSVGHIVAAGRAQLFWPAAARQNRTQL